MNDENSSEDTLRNWSKYPKVYDPVKCASIDGTDVLPHDRAVERALKSTYRPNRFVKGRPQCTIFVSRLNHDTTKDTIKEIFSKYGKLKRFRMVKDIVTGMPKGYAFVEYEEERAAEDAYRLANKMVVDGNIIFVDFECERLLKGWKPRRLGGGFGGKKESGQLRFGGRDRPFKKPIALEIQEEEERKLKEKERRKREEEKRRDKCRDKTERSRKRSHPRNNSHSPGRKERNSPGRKEHNSPGRKEHNSPGRKEHNSPGRKERNSPGKKERNSPGKKERNSPGRKERNSPGRRERNSPGRKERNSPGRKERNSPGRKEHNSPPRKIRRYSPTREIYKDSPPLRDREKPRYHVSESYSRMEYSPQREKPRHTREHVSSPIRSHEKYHSRDPLSKHEQNKFYPESPKRELCHLKDNTQNDHNSSSISPSHFRYSSSLHHQNHLDLDHSTASYDAQLNHYEYTQKQNEHFSRNYLSSESKYQSHYDNNKYKDLPMKSNEGYSQDRRPFQRPNQRYSPLRVSTRQSPHRESRQPYRPIYNKRSPTLDNYRHYSERDNRRY